MSEIERDPDLDHDGNTCKSHRDPGYRPPRCGRLPHHNGEHKGYDLDMKLQRWPNPDEPDLFAGVADEIDKLIRRWLPEIQAFNARVAQPPMTLDELLNVARNIQPWTPYKVVMSTRHLEEVRLTYPAPPTQFGDPLAWAHSLPIEIDDTAEKPRMEPL